MLAVLWPDPSARRSGAGAMLSLLKRHGLKASEVEGNERREALAAFASGRNWYRPSALNRLSEEEALVIAARMVARLRARIEVTSDQAERLVTSITNACARILPNASATSAPVRGEEIGAAILGGGREVLSAAELTVLAEAAALGHRPLPGEA